MSWIDQKMHFAFNLDNILYRLNDDDSDDDDDFACIITVVVIVGCTNSTLFFLYSTVLFSALCFYFAHCCIWNGVFVRYVLCTDLLNWENVGVFVTESIVTILLNKLSCADHPLRMMFEKSNIPWVVRFKCANKYRTIYKCSTALYIQVWCE